MELGVEHARAELPCADRGCTAFGERYHFAQPVRAAGPAVRHRAHHRAIRTRELRDLGKWLRDSRERASRAYASTRSLGREPKGNAAQTRIALADRVIRGNE